MISVTENSTFVKVALSSLHHSSYHEHKEEGQDVNETLWGVSQKGFLLS